MCMVEGSCQERSEVSHVGEIAEGVDSRFWRCTSLTSGSPGAMYGKAALSSSKLRRAPHLLRVPVFKGYVELGPRKAER